MRFGLSACACASQKTRPLHLQLQLHCTALHCTALHCIALLCTARQPCCTCRQPDSGQSASATVYPPVGSSNAFKAQLRNNITRISGQHAQQGIPATEQDLYDRAALEHSLKQDYVSVNLQHPGITVQCLEPPVLTVNNFMTADECHQLAQAAEATGKAASVHFHVQYMLSSTFGVYTGPAVRPVHARIQPNTVCA